MTLRQLAIRSIKTAAIATAATSAALMLASKRDTGSPWAAFNSICHMVDGDAPEFPLDFAPRETLLGAGLNASAIASWAVLYEWLFGGVPLPSSAIWAALATAGVWIVDYRLVPKRFTPGFEKRLDKKSIALAYVALAATFALSSAWNTDKKAPP
jgi:hypothetical protein